MISIDCTTILEVPVPYMLDVTPTDVGDELDAINPARLKWINFHNSIKTFFGQTRDRSSRCNALLDKLYSATRQSQPFEIVTAQQQPQPQQQNNHNCSWVETK